VQEEIGCAAAKPAAFGIDPHVGIAVDVTHATDCPTIDKRQQGEVGLGKGPVIFRGPNMNPRITERLIETSQTISTAVPIVGDWRATPNDANVLQITAVQIAGRADRYSQPLHAQRR
jgi:endoglucanase